MKHLNHSLLALLILCLTAPLIAQDKGDEKSAGTKNSRTQGLRKITPPRHWDIDDDIEVHVERAVAQAMQSVEVALEKMEVNLRHLEIEPVEVHIPHIAVEPVEVHIPPIAIEPIDVIIPAIDINIPRIDVDHRIRHRHDWNDDADENHKHNSDKDNEKAKGLKKIN